ncbi:MAG TPA: FAD-binding oxidoreductase [Thermoanaerobaculia bacterium]|nr:FAD-binding oxidoreductase [Thermoanaerobaculia bacterium]
MSPDPSPERIDPVRYGLRPVEARHVGALRDLLGADAVLAEPDRLEPFARDETEALRFPPDVAVLPSTPEQVAAVLRLANEELLPVVARGAGTGLSGGALPVCGGIVLSLERLDRIRAIDERDQVAEAEAGVVLADLQAAVEARGLFYPPDPSSRESCRLGGNLAEDAAGPRSAKFGPTRRWVLGLEAVLADGTLLELGSRCRKDATGLHLTQLLVGSEGTLAVITAARLRLIARPRASLTAILPFPSLESAAAAVEGLFAAGLDPAACELMEAAAIDAVARVEPLPQALAGRPALLLVELLGEDRDELLGRAGRLDELATGLGAGETLIADEPAGERRLWAVRRRIGEAVKSISSYKEADTVVPRSRLAELVVAARSAAARHGLEAIVYGHAGDGNLHVNLLRGDLGEAEWRRRRDAAERELFDAVIGLGGRLTGEHGVGWVQRDLLPLALSEREIDLQRAIKRAFDPRGILNPGKLFPDPPA